MSAPTDNHRMRGFSLVELMVALTTGLLVAGVIATMFASNARTYAVTSGIGELQEAGRVAFDVLQRDLRMAGYRGCDSRGAAAALQARSEATGDVLELDVPAGEAAVLTSPMRDAEEPLQALPPRGTVVGDRLLIADCKAAAVLRVTGLGDGLIRYDSHVNDQAALPRAFGSDALLLRLETHRYYVAPASRGGAGQRSLWRQVDAHAPIEVAGDVQELRLQFGLDTDGDGVPNRYVGTGDVGVNDWARVSAVQLNLLLRGGVSGRTAASSSYVFNGRTVAPGDRRMYRVYSATLPLRNRQS